jgi:hypothetical protein
MPCRDCGGAIECGVDPKELCSGGIEAASGHASVRSSRYDGPTPVNVYAKTEGRRCVVRLAPEAPGEGFVELGTYSGPTPVKVFARRGHHGCIARLVPVPRVRGRRKTVAAEKEGADRKKAPAKAKKVPAKKKAPAKARKGAKAKKR